MNLQSYAPIFAESEKKVGENYDFSTFRDDPNFGFACAKGTERLGPEYPALGLATTFNPPLCSQFMLQPKSKLGYNNPDGFQRWDVVDSRHIMMMTFLFDKFPGLCLVIGSHSLSEFEMSVFDDYFENVVAKCDSLFYATHIALPSAELVALKIKRIREAFPRETAFISEGGMVFNALFSRA